MKFTVDVTRIVDGKRETRCALNTNDREKALALGADEALGEGVFMVEVFEFGRERPIAIFPEPKN